MREQEQLRIVVAGGVQHRRETLLHLAEPPVREGAELGRPLQECREPVRVDGGGVPVVRCDAGPSWPGVQQHPGAVVREQQHRAVQPAALGQRLGELPAVADGGVTERVRDLRGVRAIGLDGELAHQPIAGRHGAGDLLPRTLQRRTEQPGVLEVPAGRLARGDHALLARLPCVDDQTTDEHRERRTDDRGDDLVQQPAAESCVVGQQHRDGQQREPGQSGEDQQLPRHRSTGGTSRPDAHLYSETVRRRQLPLGHCRRTAPAERRHVPAGAAPSPRTSTSPSRQPCARPPATQEAWRNLDFVVAHSGTNLPERGMPRGAPYPLTPGQP
jgi:hypothetical protein